MKREIGMMEKQTLIFVYNADSGFINTLFDVAHKIFSPATYECNLCAITHTATGMREEWREFLDQLDIDLDFLHRDELQKRYPQAVFPLPAILMKHGNNLSEFIGQEEINHSQTMSELKTLIEDRLAALSEKN